MSVLDDVFGSRDIPQMPEAHVTDWPDAPENLRPILDEWQAITGFRPDSKVVRRLWITGSAQWYEAMRGQQIELFRRAAKKLIANCEKNNSIRPSHPGAIIKTAVGEMMAGAARESPQDKWMRENFDG